MTTSPMPREHESADAYVGEQVHSLMFKRMSQIELGVLIGVDQSTVSKKLRGTRSWTLDELLVVSRHFQVPVTDLLPGDDYDPVLVGRGRGAVRHVGLEPTTRWLTLSPVVAAPELEVLADVVALGPRRAARDSRRSA